MNSIIKKASLAVLCGLVFAAPLVASAHEHAIYQIGQNHYQIVIGSLNEPIAVDDKTGIDLTVTQCFTPACAATRSSDGEMDGPAGTPVTGLESTLKVEISAGNQKRMLDISPVYGKAGSYTSPFYPTVATTLTYRVNGTINDVPVDLSFSCLPESAKAPETDMTAKKLSDGVTQTMHGGKFGCPKPKEGFGFPEPSASLATLNMDTAKGSTKSSFALALGAAALALSVVSFAKRK